MMRPAIFIDRDGTMVHDVGYLSRLEDLHWYPWTIDAVRLLHRAGFLVCVTTNQSGIALGFCTDTFVRRVHDEMSAAIVEAGGRVDGWFYCPHHPQAQIDALRLDCDCRKPRPGLIRQAQERFPIDLARSFVIGDKSADIGLASSVGARGVLVKTGYGESELTRHDGQMPGAAHVAADLLAATTWILRESGHPKDEG
jgi:D-glycero-D-manno-heptose 1,7-bisphosphate phosphatase